MNGSLLRLLQVAVLCTALSSAGGSTSLHDADSRKSFPDLAGYRTMKCDFHQHTVFSDGEVWPNLRVQEAIRDGLDAFAITDHLEYQPHRSDIPHPDRNRSFRIALEAAKTSEILVIHGVEVTRGMPPGHLNALFIQNANTLLHDDAAEVLREAKRQGAFVFWNHPWWLRQAPDGIARTTEVHDRFFEEGLVHGIEVVNNDQYSEEALQIALDRNLTIVGNSDIHGLSEWIYPVKEGAHRPVTLVFDTEQTETALRTALFERRTVVWFKQTLIGRAEWIGPLLTASLSVESGNYQPDSTVVNVVIANESAANFVLRNVSSMDLLNRPGLVEVKARQSSIIAVKTVDRPPRISIDFEVLNAFTAPGVHPRITFTFDVESE